MNNGAKLYDAGYTDLVFVKGGTKAPAFGGWRYAQYTRGQVAEWGGSFGLRGDMLPGVDIDIYEDEELSTEVALLIVGALGPAPLRLSHRPSSKLLPYRSEAPFPKKVLTLPDGQGKIEVLGLGRQYLVDGPHEDGGHYRWAGQDLWDIPPHKLSLVTEKDVDKLLVVLQKKFGGVIASGRGKERGEHAAQEDLLAPSLEHVVDALSQIPNSDAFLSRAFPGSEARDAWIAMGHAVYGAGGPAAEEAFVAWTLSYQDGAADEGLARAGYRSCADTYTGWPTIEKILRELLKPDLGEMFVADLGEAPPYVEYVPPTIQYTDEDHVDQLLPRLEGKLLFSNGAWFIWDGGHWTRDGKEGLIGEAIVRDVLRPYALEIRDTAFAYTDDDPKKQEKVRSGILKTAAKLQNRSGIQNITALLRARLTVDIEAFDTDPMVLNTPSGLVDLATGATRPALPEDMNTRVTAVGPAAKYEPASAPQWERFLDHLCKGDPEIAGYLQRYMGYSLTGAMREKAFVFAWGSSSNTGKSTFINAVTGPLGTYHRTVDVNLFMQKKGTTYTMAKLPGVRLVTATEPSAGQKWDDKIIKTITGGDPVECREIYMPEFTFRPQFKVLIAGNHEPELQGVDTPLLKRINIVPMNNVVAEPDGQLGEKLAAEAPQILRWMIEGSQAWMEERLSPPRAVQAATEEYREEADTMARWLEECCDMEAGARTTTSILYANWESWNLSRGTKHPLRLNPFSKELTTRGLERYRTGSERGFEGIRIKPRISIVGEAFA